MTTSLIERASQTIASQTTASQTRLPLPISAQRKTTRRFRFLIVGYGHYGYTENAVGPWVARAIARWQVPAVKSIAVPQLTPALVSEIAAADYCIFVTARSQAGHCRSVRVMPVVGQQRPPELDTDTHSCDPRTLLNLTQHLYGNVPLAWLIQVAEETTIEKEPSRSKLAQNGDRALQTIEQFLRTYR